MGYVYTITNIITGKFYVGSTTNFNRRIDSHFSHLKSAIHSSIRFQRSYNKYGDSVWKPKIVYTGPDYIAVEQELLDEFFDESYNCSKNATGGDNLSYHPDRDAIIEKIRTTLLNNSSNMTDEEKREKWGRPGESNPNWRGGSSTSYCSCGIMKSVGSKTCSDCRDRTGKNNPFYGKTHTEETLVYLSELQKERCTNPEFVFAISESQATGIAETPLGKFSSINQAARGNGISFYKAKRLFDNPNETLWIYKPSQEFLDRPKRNMKKLLPWQPWNRQNHGNRLLNNFLEFDKLYKEISENLSQYIVLLTGCDHKTRLYLYSQIRYVVKNLHLGHVKEMIKQISESNWNLYETDWDSWKLRYNGLLPNSE